MGNLYGSYLPDVSEKLSSFENIRDSVSARLVNAGANKSFLADKPFRLVEDLAVVYFVVLEEREGAQAGTYITSSLIDRMNVTEKELYRAAMENIRKKPPRFTTLRAAIEEIMGAGMPFSPPFSDEGLYLLSNAEKLFGAAAMLDERAMTRIGEEIGSFYILPSSVHEVILLRALRGTDTNALAEMVRDINMTYVEAHERLSDNIYFCEAGTGRFRMLPQSF